MKTLDGIVLAASERSEREPLRQAAERHGVKIFFGPDDPLQRLIAAGRAFNAGVAVRVTGNAPFIDPRLADELVVRHRAAVAACFSRAGGYPAGVVPEVFTLETFAKGGTSPAAFYREMLNDKRNCRLVTTNEPEGLSLKINSRYDAALAEKIAARLGGAANDYPALIAALPDIVYGFLAAADAPEKRHYNAMLEDLEAAAMSVTVRSVPGFLKMEVHNLCNIKCATCVHQFNVVPKGEFATLFKGFPPENLLAYPLFKDRGDGFFSKQSVPLSPKLFGLMRELLFPYVRAVSFGVYGEVFLNHHLEEYVRLGKKDGLTVIIVTNGTLMREQRARALVDAGLDVMAISFDGASKEVFEDIRRGADYDKVAGNLKTVVRLRSESGKKLPVIQIQFTASNKNIHELPALVRLAAGWGVDIIDVSYCFITGFMDPADSLYFHQGKTRDTVSHARLLAAGLGIRMTLSREMAMTVDGVVDDAACRFPWRIMDIGSNGNMQMCGCHYVESAGNILETPVMEILNAPRYREVRRGLRKEAAMHPICQGCRATASEPPNPAGFFAVPEMAAAPLYSR
ncbi:MAG: radical SAM protein [Nitrospinae bacterium]|nr:radical SAM protein [Nitrospinota bacterium]